MDRGARIGPGGRLFDRGHSDWPWGAFVRQGSLGLALGGVCLTGVARIGPGRRLFDRGRSDESWGASVRKGSLRLAVGGDCLTGVPWLSSRPGLDWGALAKPGR